MIRAVIRAFRPPSPSSLPSFGELVGLCLVDVVVVVNWVGIGVVGVDELAGPVLALFTLEAEVVPGLFGLLGFLELVTGLLGILEVFARCCGGCALRFMATLSTAKPLPALPTLATPVLLTVCFGLGDFLVE